MNIFVKINTINKVIKYKLLKLNKIHKHYKIITCSDYKIRKLLRSNKLIEKNKIFICKSKGNYSKF